MRRVIHALGMGGCQFYWKAGSSSPLGQRGNLARWYIGQEITAVRVAPYLPLCRHRLMGHQA
jgi:hypothetical protein